MVPIPLETDHWSIRLRLDTWQGRALVWGTFQREKVTNYKVGEISSRASRPPSPTTTTKNKVQVTAPLVVPAYATFVPLLVLQYYSRATSTVSSSVLLQPRKARCFELPHRDLHRKKNDFLPKLQTTKQVSQPRSGKQRDRLSFGHRVPTSWQTCPRLTVAVAQRLEKVGQGEAAEGGGG